MTVALRAGLRPALLLAGLLAAGLAVRAMPGGGAAAVLGAAAADQGPLHLCALVLLGAAFCAAGLPRQLVCYAAGVAFGAGAGMAVALAAQLLGCMADLAWARLLARRWVATRLRGRLARIDATLSARPFLCTLSLRLLPVGSNLLLNLAAGVSGVAATPFFVASAIGYTPQTVVFVLAGSGVRVGHPAQIALAAALFLLSATLGLWLLRRQGPPAALSAVGSGAATPRP